MSITEPKKEINDKNLTKKSTKIDLVLIGLLCFLVATAFFGYVGLSKIREGKSSPFLASSALYGSEVRIKKENLSVVASKNGTKYYAKTCAAANRIKPENLITFESREEAESRGFTPAANCPDLKEF